MSAVLTRLELLLEKILLLRVLLVSSEFQIISRVQCLMISSSNPRELVAVTKTKKETTLALAAAHALVLLEDGTMVGDPMEKTTLSALDWKLTKGDNLAPSSKDAPHKMQINIKRRYQFSSALKRMSTISSVVDGNGRKFAVAVKGAPETLKGMYNQVPEWYDETYRWYTRRGSRVLALGYKTMNLDPSKVSFIDFLVRIIAKCRSTPLRGMRSSANLNSLGSWSSIVPLSLMLLRL
jgi:magnesium-transporting ATPase (P-type)